MSGKVNLRNLFRIPQRTPAEESSSATQGPQQQSAIAVGDPAQNPLVRRGPIRMLPTEIKLLIAELASGSPTAFAATLRIPTKGGGTWGAADVVLKLNMSRQVLFGKHAPTVTEVAAMIARNSTPNVMRDALRKPGSADLHESIPLRHFASSPNFIPRPIFTAGYRVGETAPRSPTECEHEQVRLVLGSDFSVLLEHLGKVSEEVDMQALSQIENQFKEIQDGYNNPNGWVYRDDRAPSTSALSDVLLQGLAWRLHELKGQAQLKGSQLISSSVLSTTRDRIFGSEFQGIFLWPQQGALRGASQDARAKALSDALRAARTGVLDRASQETILNATLCIFAPPMAGIFDSSSKEKVAIQLGKAVPRVDSETEEQSLAHKALTGFRELISGTMGSCHRVSRAKIIGAVAESLGEKAPPLPTPGAGKERTWLMRLIGPKESSMLDCMLEAIALPSKWSDRHRSRGRDGLNLYLASVNVYAWPGLMKVTSELDETEKKKIANAFLQQIEKSRLLVYSDDIVYANGDCLAYHVPQFPEQRGLKFIPAFQALKTALPHFHDCPAEEKN